MNNFIKNKKGGTVLLMTLLILMSILVVTLAAGEIVRMGLIMSRTQVHSTKAYYAAEAGAERILWDIRKDGFDVSSDCNSDDCIIFGTPNTCDAQCDNPNKVQTLSNMAKYKVKYEFVAGDIILTCYGFYEHVSRVVELRF